MNPQKPANTRRSQPAEPRATELRPDQAPEAEPPADETPAAQEETPDQTEALPSPTSAASAAQNATLQAIKNLFSDLGGVAKHATLPTPSGGDSHNIIKINVTVLIGDNQWAGNVDGGIGGTINSQHGL